VYAPINLKQYVIKPWYYMNRGRHGIVLVGLLMLDLSHVDLPTGNTVR